MKDLTAYGQLLQGHLLRAGVTTDELATMSSEAGYPVDGDVIDGHMHDYYYERDNLNVVRGPAEVFGLDMKAKTKLAVAYLFNK